MRRGVSAILLGALVVLGVLLVGVLIYFNPSKASSGEMQFGNATVSTVDTDGDGIRDTITIETKGGTEITIKPGEGKIEGNALVLEDTDGDGKVDTVEDRRSGKRWQIPGSEGTGTVEKNVGEGEEANEHVWFPFDPSCWADPTCWEGVFGGFGGFGEENEEEGGGTGPYLPPAVDIGLFGADRWGWIPFGPPQLPGDESNNEGTVNIPVLRFGGIRGVAIDLDRDGKYDLLQDKERIFFDSDGDGEADLGYEEGDSYDVFVDFGRKRIAVDIGKDGSINLWKEGRNLCIDLDGDGSCEAEAETDESGNIGNYRYDEVKIGRFLGPEVLSKLSDPKALEDYVKEHFSDYLDAWNRVRSWENVPAVKMPKLEFKQIRLPGRSPANASPLENIEAPPGVYTDEEIQERCWQSVNTILRVMGHEIAPDSSEALDTISRALDDYHAGLIAERYVTYASMYRVENPEVHGTLRAGIPRLPERWPDVNANGKYYLCAEIWGTWHSDSGERTMYHSTVFVCDKYGKIYYFYTWIFPNYCRRHQ